MSGYGKFILDGDGNPVEEPNVLKWGEWMETAQRHVANDHVGDVHVSTVFLGLDHSWDEGEPILYETMVFGGLHDQLQERYATREQAAAGHAKVLAMVREGAMPL